MPCVVLGYMIIRLESDYLNDKKENVKNFYYYYLVYAMRLMRLMKLGWVMTWRRSGRGWCWCG